MLIIRFSIKDDVALVDVGKKSEGRL